MNKLIIVAYFFCTSLLLNGQDVSTYTEEEIKVQSQFLEGKIALYKGDTIAAIKIFKKLTKTTIEANSNLELSKIYRQQKTFDEAIVYGEKAKLYLSNQENVLLHMLGLYQNVNDETSYLMTLQTLSDNFPDNLGYVFQLLDKQIEAEQYKIALKTLTEREEKYGIQEESTKRLFDLYIAQNKVKKAEKQLLKIIDKYPEELTYLYNLASFYTQIAEHKKAESVYQRILILNPDDQTASSILSLPSHNNDELLYLQALLPVVQNPDSNIDEIIPRLLPYIEAISDKEDDDINQMLLLICEQLVEAKPGEAKANSVYGDVLYLTGKLKESKNQYLKTLDITKAVFSVWNQLFVTYERLGEFKELVEFTEMAMDYYPNMSEVYIYNSYAHAHLDNITKAEDALKEAKYMLSTSSSYSKQHFQLAQIIIDIKNNNLNKAIDSLKLFETNKDKLSFEILEKLSKIFLLLDMSQKAREFLDLSYKKGNYVK